MRKIAAILLCGIFFFNWVGYRLLNGILEEDATHRLDAQLDQQQYREDQLITIKVPLSDLAYYNNSANFERSDGHIEINGIPYRYVKCRIYQDSLEMKCIPNQGALTLRQTAKNYFNGVSGIEQQQGAKSPSHPGAYKSFQQEPYIGIGLVRVGEPFLPIILHGNYFSAGLSSLTLPTDERPPAAPAA